MPDVLDRVAVRKDSSDCTSDHTGVVADKHLRQRLTKKLSVTLEPGKELLDLSVVL